MIVHRPDSKCFKVFSSNGRGAIVWFLTSLSNPPVSKYKVLLLMQTMFLYHKYDQSYPSS